MKATIIGAALDLGAGRRGVDMGPSAIRYAGLEERLTTLGVDCVDRGNVASPVAEAIAHILARAKAHGVIAGIHNGTPEAALKRIEKGFQFVTVSSDARLIAAGAQQVLAKMRAHAGDGSKPAGY